MKYPTLYARDSKGKVRVWWVERNGASYHVLAGLQDGAKVPADPTIAKPKNVGKKNATTAEEQAHIQIEALYEKKKKDHYFEDIKDIDKKLFFEVMLAEPLKKAKKYLDKIFGKGKVVIVQIKFNGGRAVAHIKGLYTRTGEKYFTIPHIVEDVKSVFEKYPDAVLDGELYNYSLREKLNELTTIVSVNRQKIEDITPELLAESEKIVRFYVYDGFRDLEMKKASYEVRQAWINEVIKDLKYCVAVKSVRARNKEQVDVEFEKALEDKQEGVMVRILDVEYEQKRTKNLIKYKPLDDDEGTLVEFHEGDGNWANKVKMITVNWKGRTFKVSFKGNMEMAAKLWQEWLKNPEKFIGQTRTFEYYGLNGKGLPNFAQMDWNNSIKS